MAQETLKPIVTHMDDSSLEAHLSGTATADGKVSFDGTLKVQRTGAHTIASTGGTGQAPAAVQGDQGSRPHRKGIRRPMRPRRFSCR